MPNGGRADDTQSCFVLEGLRHVTVRVYGTTNSTWWSYRDAGGTWRGWYPGS